MVEKNKKSIKKLSTGLTVKERFTQSIQKTGQKNKLKNFCKLLFYRGVKKYTRGVVCNN